MKRLFHSHIVIWTACGLVPWLASAASVADAQSSAAIFVMNADAAGPRRVMNADGTGPEWLCEGQRPRCSPDGDKIVFASHHEGFESLYVLDTLELQRTRVLERGYDHIIGASWSPDGKQLVFVGYKGGRAFQGGRGELAVVDASADQKPKVLQQGEVGWHPDWSPDGKRVVFWFRMGQNERLHLLDMVREQPRVMLPGQTTPRNSDPVWSPDGKQIAFSTDRAR